MRLSCVLADRTSVRRKSLHVLVRTVLFDEGGRARTRSDWRAGAYSVGRLLFDGGERLLFDGVVRDSSKGDNQLQSTYPTKQVQFIDQNPIDFLSALTMYNV